MYTSGLGERSFLLGNFGFMLVFLVSFSGARYTYAGYYTIARLFCGI